MPVRVDQRDQILAATDLVRLIGESVALKARGREYIGLCPFHDDKNPSLHVSPAKQIYKCFSCGAGGTAFDFMMNYHKMTFVEALKHLADRAGIKLESAHGARGTGDEPTDRQRIAEANQLALGFFRSLLRHPEHGREARQYIEKRGISPEMVEAFQIGYAPDRWDGLVLTIGQKGWNRRGFELAGLISPRQASASHPEGSYYDRLRHRLIFPICDQLGRVIAFGGRKLCDEDEPKYLNSPETLLFNKSATLFGLHLAKKAIIDSKTAVIVEGYTDVIACHQAGVTNVVATLGTALTMEHVAVLRRFCENVVLIFDADEAGQKAADRALELFLTGDLDVTIAVLPDGLDPAELFEREDGRAQWEAAIARATDALTYQFERIRNRFEAAQTLTGRQRVMEDYLRKLAQLGLGKAGPIRRAIVLQRVSQLLHVDEAQVNDLLRQFTPRNALRPELAAPETSAPVNIDNAELDVVSGESDNRMKALQAAESQLIGALLRFPVVFHETLSDGRTLDEAITASDLVTSAAALLYRRIYDRLAEGQSVSLVQLLGELAAENEPRLVRLATEAEAQVEQLDQGDEQFAREVARQAAECILRFRNEQSYQQARQAFVSMKERANPSTEQEYQMIRDLLERARANQSPVRIKRIGVRM